MYKSEGSLTQEQLKQYLDYDLDTGIFAWLQFRVGVKRKQAGFIHNHSGYRYIGLLGGSYPASCLACLYVKGRWPKEGYEMDHEDRNRSNDAWENLREVSRTSNNKNHPIPCNNTSGVLGVYAQTTKTKGLRYKAQIVVDRKTIFLGTFDTCTEAAAARKRADEEYRFHKNHGMTI